ncbi:MAG: maleylacetate reductase [Burkholderiales bacterium]|nr:maleylacetate reductase [Burkholderiales bacterium]
MNDFVFHMRMPRVVFGAGALQHVRREVEAIGAERALVLSTPGQAALAQRVVELLGEHAAGVFSGAAMHVPVETVSAAEDRVQSVDANCLIAIGGGSTTGLAKALALDSGIPVIAIPTTYAGSEMTTMYGLTEGGAKRTGRDASVLPRCVIYDPELSLGLPFPTTVVSAINAIAHAAEGLYAPDGNPVVDLYAQEGMRRSAAALPRLQANPRDIEARGDALVGAWMCGVVMGSVTVGLHHKLCHTLGGSFGLPHAELHTVVLPHALAYNAPAVPEAMRKIAAALLAPSAPGGVFDLAARHGAATSLRAIGMREADLDRAAELAMQGQYPNPRPLERGPLRELLQRAWAGVRPD